MPVKNCHKCCRKIKAKQKQVSCDICHQHFHKLCIDLNNSTYRKIFNNQIPYFCLNCQAEIFPFFNQNNSDLSLLNSGFNNFNFSSNSKIVPNESLKSLFNTCNSIETPFNGKDHSFSINSKYYDVIDFNDIIHDKHSSFSVLHLNIASLPKHFEDLQNYISLLKQSFDIIAITEHKISLNSNEKSFNLPGYNFCFNFTESTHGGTGFFISEKLNYKVRNDLNMCQPGNLESTFIELILPFKRNLVLGCVYKHPRMKINEFNENFLDPVLEKIDKERKTCLLMGDFNINLLNIESDKLVSNFYDLMTSRCFAPFILQPTRITEKSKTLIDNIFMNSLEYDTFSGNLTTLISDHLPQFLILKNFHRKYTNKSQVVYKRSYKFYNEDEFKKDLLNVNWDETFNNTNADASFDTFLSIINKLLDEHAPLKKLSKREVVLKQKP